MLIRTHNDLRNAVDHFFKSRRDFIQAFESEGGTVDETAFSRQLSGNRNLSSAWLSAYNIFFVHFLRDVIADYMEVRGWKHVFEYTEYAVFFSSDNQEAREWIESKYPGRWNSECFFFDFSKKASEKC
jgi:hypothetical protein